ncbi:MAG: bifunctional heptose 7-phosphate kinase/heptose 1-phosphate adenyltransferase [Planctomycetota bacterium]|nr:MAG: bifunctional heptose 7-phosphate kinase/heptose 1-phosphate adenyltransferase [Planctomycetota bacterium]
MIDSLIRIVDRLGEPNILVLGDLILDKYVWGSVDRVSPEAPIPVLEVEEEETRPGGAGCVAVNLAVLGAKVRLCGLLGRDGAGNEYLRRLSSTGIDVSGVVQAEGFQTTQKTRMVGTVQSHRRAAQHILRVDRESTLEIPAEAVELVGRYLGSLEDNIDAILISDYFKGFVTSETVQAAVEIGRRLGAPVIVDPRRSKDYSLYRGVTGITPNRYEAQLVTDVSAVGDNLATCGEKLVRMLDLDFCAITVDKDGIYLVRGDGTDEYFSTEPKAVYDVTGAGDMVLAAVGIALASGENIEDALRLANVAAGIEVSKLGAASVSRDEVRTALIRRHPFRSTKIIRRDELEVTLRPHRDRREQIVFTNGCFDVLHAGHIHFLRFCKGQGDTVVVGLNSDGSVREIKGEGRPVFPEQERAQVLSALEYVNYIVLFDEPTPAALVEEVAPDVIVKGEEWREKGVVGREFVEARGGEVVFAPMVEGLSSTDIIDRIRGALRG